MLLLTSEPTSGASTPRSSSIIIVPIPSGRRRLDPLDAVDALDRFLDPDVHRLLDLLRGGPQVRPPRRPLRMRRLTAARCVIVSTPIETPSPGAAPAPGLAGACWRADVAQRCWRRAAWTHYLVPVDARLERDTDVRFETVELDVLAATTVASRPNDLGWGTVATAR